MKCAENLLDLYCDVDDFVKKFLPEWKKHLASAGKIQRNRSTRMSESEIMALLIHFQQSRYRDFKSYYLQHVLFYLKKEFPNALSYQRFVALIPRVFVLLMAYLQSRKVDLDGFGFVDSTKLIVCHTKRTRNHQIFKEYADVGMSSMGWFYGFKLHLICNHRGEIVECKITPGNVNDLATMPQMTRGLLGKIFGDKGYISQKLFNELFQRGLHLVTGIKKNMKNKFMPLFDKIMLRKRSLIESINNQLKNVFQIEHTRHRSPINGFINILSALTAYTHHKNKPSLNLTKEQENFMRLNQAA